MKDEIEALWSRPVVQQLLAPITTERQRRAVTKKVEELLLLVGEEDHPLGGLLEILTLHLEAYEDAHEPIEAASGAEVLRLLMRQHRLKQADLAPELGGQGNVSDVLSGKRELNVRQIRTLAARFRVSPAAFFGSIERQAGVGA